MELIVPIFVILLVLIIFGAFLGKIAWNQAIYWGIALLIVGLLFLVIFRVVG